MTCKTLSSLYYILKRCYSDGIIKPDLIIIVIIINIIGFYYPNLEPNLHVNLVFLYDEFFPPGSFHDRNLPDSRSSTPLDEENSSGTKGRDLGRRSPRPRCKNFDGG